VDVVEPLPEVCYLTEVAYFCIVQLQYKRELSQTDSLKLLPNCLLSFTVDV